MNADIVGTEYAKKRTDDFGDVQIPGAEPNISVTVSRDRIPEFSTHLHRGRSPDATNADDVRTAQTAKARGRVLRGPADARRIAFAVGRGPSQNVSSDSARSKTAGRRGTVPTPGTARRQTRKPSVNA